MAVPHRPRRRTRLFMEVGVAILLLSVLAAVGIGRLARTHDHAVDANLERLTGALQTAVAAFHANWKLNGNPHLDVPGWGDGSLDANGVGFPVSGRRDSAAVSDDRDCVDIWRGLLQDAPRVARAEPTRVTGASFPYIEPKLGTGVMFVAGQEDWIGDATVPLPDTPHAEICQFISLHHQSVQAGAPKPTIFYDSRTGTVLLDLERVF